VAALILTHLPGCYRFIDAVSEIYRDAHRHVHPGGGGSITLSSFWAELDGVDDYRPDVSCCCLIAAPCNSSLTDCNKIKIKQRSRRRWRRGSTIYDKKKNHKDENDDDDQLTGPNAFARPPPTASWRYASATCTLRLGVAHGWKNTYDT
jgi:hypothetical protein